MRGERRGGRGGAGEILRPEGLSYRLGMTGGGRDGGFLAVPAGSRRYRGETIFLGGRDVEEEAGGCDFGVHVGKHELDGLKFGDRLAEGLAFASEFYGCVQGGLG